MKRVGSIKQALKPSLKSNSNHSDVANNNSDSKMSILGNSGLPSQINGHSKPDFHLPKSISSFLKKGTLTRKKDKSNQVSLRARPSTPQICLLLQNLFGYYRILLN